MARQIVDVQGFVRVRCACEAALIIEDNYEPHCTISGPCPHRLYDVNESEYIFEYCLATAICIIRFQIEPNRLCRFKGRRKCLHCTCWMIRVRPNLLGHGQQSYSENTQYWKKVRSTHSNLLEESTELRILLDLAGFEFLVGSALAASVFFSWGEGDDEPDPPSLEGEVEMNLK